MGKKATYEPIARRRYADGMTLEQISAETGVSVPTLSTWKNETKDPTTKVDEWDRARQQKQSNIQRLKDLFERELEHVEEQEPGSISPASMDALTKLGSLVRNWESMLRAEASAQNVAAPEIDRPALFLENMEWLAGQLKETDPEGLKVLARNFDELIIRFKAEHAKTS